ncbi:unnamed protein product [Gongylonema pulchrum]|uniref:GYF domain-containing protein n=1 Tax=Gongylonema pulchrum TaxID=637853 RepID=A0A183EBC6_9BILA|nr:unnamed protein product [Gongylonema pulchrum]
MTCRKISGARANPEHAESEKMRQRADSFGTGIGKVSAFAGRRGGRFIPSQAEDLAAWDFGTLGRSGSSSMASVVDSSHSRTSSFGLAGSTEDARKAILEKEAENPLEKVWSEELSKSNVQPIDDDEYVLYEPDSSTETLASGAMTSTTIIKSTPRMIGTIMEQNASSGSSRSSSPVLSKVKKSTAEDEEPEAASQVTEESFSAKEVFLLLITIEICLAQIFLDKIPTCNRKQQLKVNIRKVVFWGADDKPHKNSAIQLWAGVDLTPCRSPHRDILTLTKNRSLNLNMRL